MIPSNKRTSHGFTLVELIVGLMVASAVTALAWNLFSVLHKGYQSKQQRSKEFQEQMLLNSSIKKWRDSEDQIECRFGIPYVCKPKQGNFCDELEQLLESKIESIQKYSCEMSSSRVWIEMKLQSGRVSRIRW